MNKAIQKMYDDIAAKESVTDGKLSDLAMKQKSLKSKVDTFIEEMADKNRNEFMITEKIAMFEKKFTGDTQSNARSVMPSRPPSGVRAEVIKQIQKNTDALQDELNLVRADYGQYRSVMEPIVNDLAAVVDNVQNRVAKMETTQNFHENKLDNLNKTANMALTFQTTGAGSEMDTNMRNVM